MKDLREDPMLAPAVSDLRSAMRRVTRALDRPHMAGTGEELGDLIWAANNLRARLDELIATTGRKLGTTSQAVAGLGQPAASFAAAMQYKRVPMEIIRRQLGLSDLEYTSNYLDLVAPAALHEAMENFSLE